MTKRKATEKELEHRLARNPYFDNDGEDISYSFGTNMEEAAKVFRQIIETVVKNEPVSDRLHGILGV